MDVAAPLAALVLDIPPAVEVVEVVVDSVW